MRSEWSNRRGVALIIVLLMVSIIVALTIQLNRDTRSEVYGAANISDGIRLRYIAESGFYVGEALLLADKTSFDALTEPWANTEMIALQSEGFFDNGSFKLAIQDETGKILVNRLISGNAYNPLIREFLLRLLTGPYFHLEQRRAEELMDAIKDWIDADDEVTGGGAEGAYYAGLARPYTAKNAPIDCIEELLMVKGVNRELFYGTGDSPGLVQCLTVFGDGRININTAPRPVLRALAAEMADGDVDWLDRYRRDVRNDLADAGWYQRIPRASGLNISPALIKVNSDIFQITAVGLQGRMTERITGVVKREADRRKVKLMSWKVE
ncbi:MAG: type II secretion system minor pseudopilin GspK [Deltaproteobacteria bacterium]|nr:type II secretion system minor pseudopilin GspK [Deltaproteobacteria bacterium]